MTTYTCREVLRELLQGNLSNLMLESVLSQLGEDANAPLASLPAEYLGALRRRLERIGKNYLAPEQSEWVLLRYDRILESLQLRPIEAAVSTGRLSGRRPAEPITTQTSGQAHGFTHSTSTSDATARERAEPQPPLRFDFRDQDEFLSLRALLDDELRRFLQDDTTAARLGAGLSRAAQTTFTSGGGRIVLERDAGVRGRLVFQVIGADGKARLAGAVFAATPTG